MFWQFIGLYGEEYGVLNHLDEIDGRHTQNAAFLKMEDFGGTISWTAAFTGPFSQTRPLGWRSWTGSRLLP